MTLQPSTYFPSHTPPSEAFSNVPRSFRHNPYPLPHPAQGVLPQNTSTNGLAAPARTTLRQELERTQALVRRIIAQNTSQLTRKDQEIAGLRQELGRTQALVRRITAQNASQITGKDQVIADLRQELDRIQTLAKDTLCQHTDQLTEKDRVIADLRQELDRIQTLAKSTLCQHTDQLTEKDQVIANLRQELKKTQALAKKARCQHAPELTKKAQENADLIQKLKEVQALAKSAHCHHKSELTKKAQENAALIQQLKEVQALAKSARCQHTSELTEKNQKIADLHQRLKEIKSGKKTQQTPPCLPQEKRKIAEISQVFEKTQQASQNNKKNQEIPPEEHLPPSQNKEACISNPDQENIKITENVKLITGKIYERFLIPEKFFLPPEKAISLFLACNSESSLFRKEFTKLCWENLVSTIIDESTDKNFDSTWMKPVTALSQVMEFYYNCEDSYLKKLLSDFFSARKENFPLENPKTFFIEHPYITYELWNTYSPITINRALNGSQTWFKLIVLVIVHLGHNQAIKSYDTETFLRDALKAENPQSLQLFANTAHQTSINPLDQNKNNIKIQTINNIIKKISNEGNHNESIDNLIKYMKAFANSVTITNPPALAAIELRETMKM